jgi:hypothetical protein
VSAFHLGQMMIMLDCQKDFRTLKNIIDSNVFEKRVLGEKINNNIDIININ